MKTQNLNSCRSGKIIATLAFLVIAASAARADYPSTVLSDQPVGYWPLNLTDSNASNGVAIDVSGNGNNGSYVNISPGFNSAAGPSSYITNAVTFDGSTTFVDLSTPATNTAILNFGGPITMEAWVQPANPSAGQNMDLIGKGYDSSLSFNEVATRLDAGGGIHGGTYNQSAGNKGPTAGTQTTNWTHLVTTYDGANWNLYANGTLLARSADTVGSISFNDPWAIGAGTKDGSSRILNGNLTQVALYTNALTPNQILKHFLVGSAGTTNVPPIIAQQPASQSASPSATAVFSYQALSLLAVTNQWNFNGNPLPNQTNATLVLNNVQTNNAGNYSVTIGNSAGATNSAAATLTVVTQATTILWQTPQLISGTSDVATNGTYFGSWAPYDGGANTLPVNGVAFQGFSDIPGLSYSFSGGQGGFNGFGSPGTPDANYNALLQYGQYANSSGSSTINWGGMTPGHTYEIQFWVEDARGITGARWENLSGGDIGATIYGTDSSGPVGYSSPIFSGNASPGYYIIGTFIADSTGSEEILLSPWGSSPDTQVNLFQIRDITVLTPVHPVITHISLSGTTLTLGGTNGTAGQQFRVLSSTNLTLPPSQWTPFVTNTFTGSDFNITNTVSAETRQSFFILSVP
jgi:hypothetical protein